MDMDWLHNHWLWTQLSNNALTAYIACIQIVFQVRAFHNRVTRGGQMARGTRIQRVIKMLKMVPQPRFYGKITEPVITVHVMQFMAQTYQIFGLFLYVNEI